MNKKNSTASCCDSEEVMELALQAGHILLENSRMDSMLDDALNVHANFTVADHIAGNIPLTAKMAPLLS